jgi:hypothetical protein
MLMYVARGFGVDQQFGAILIFFGPKSTQDDRRKELCRTFSTSNFSKNRFYLSWFSYRKVRSSGQITLRSRSLADKLFSGELIFRGRSECLEMHWSSDRAIKNLAFGKAE